MACTMPKHDAAEGVPATVEEARAPFRCAPFGCWMSSGASCAERHRQGRMRMDRRQRRRLARARWKNRSNGSENPFHLCAQCAAGAARAQLLTGAEA